MRTLVRAHSIVEVNKRVKVMEGQGWKAISDVKLDDSEITYNMVYYVCVMEQPDKPHNQKRKWGQIY